MRLVNDSRFFWFLIACQRDVGTGFKKLFPELGAFPDRFRVLRVLLDYGENAGRDNAVRATEVGVDFLQR